MHPVNVRTAPIVLLESATVCKRFYAERIDTGKITIFRGYLSLEPPFERNAVTLQHEMLSQKLVFVTMS